MARKDRYALEHRVIAYDAMPLLVNRTVHIHHRNGNKTDNRIENLEVLGIVEHALRHAAAGIILNQYGKWTIGTGWTYQRRLKKQDLGVRFCEVCRKDITNLRLDATVCGNNCRVKRWKKIHRQAYVR